MQINKRAFVLLMAAVVTAGTIRAMAQSDQQQQPPASQQQPAQRATTARGELTAVDDKAMTLTIRPAEGSPMQFHYTDKTKVTGAQKDVAGLATMAGVQVTIHYTAQERDLVATEIEVQSKAK